MPKPEHINPAARVYVGNLDYSTTFDDLDATFGSYGPIKDKYMPLRPEDKRLNKGCAFVEFEHPADAAAAVAGSQHLKGVNGRDLQVKIADDRKPKN